MSSASPLIVVTGANRGIGFEIVRQLARRGAQVILTARKKEAGSTAIDRLKAEGLSATFEGLDVTDPRSVEGLKSFLTGTGKRLDVLINNAGILSDEDANVLEVELDTVRSTFETNMLAPLRLVQALAGLFGEPSRIINVSSGMGTLSGMEPDHAAYRLSKAGLNALTLMLAAEFAGRRISVNSACPGWVRTDMGGPNAEREVGQGADTPVWLALDAPQSLTGKFVRDRKVIPW